MFEDLGAVLEGAGRVCLITGDAGVGKTHLLKLVIEEARTRGCSVLSGRAHSYDRGIAYASLRDQLTSAPMDEFNVEERSELEDLIVEVDAAMLGASSVEMVKSDARPPGHIITRFLTGLSRRRPTVLVLDDAHLADAESLRALSFIARYSVSLPMYVVFSARRDRLPASCNFTETIGRLIDTGLGGVIELEPLGPSETNTLIASILSTDSDEELAAYVFEQSRGNPLFIQEVLRALKELGCLGRTNNKSYLIATPDIQAPSGREGLLRRVFQQDRAGLALARTLSAFRRVRVDQMVTLELVTGLSDSEIMGALESLVNASIITRDSSGRIEFVHPLMAEVLYNDLAPDERRRLHSLIAASFNDGQLSEPTDVLEWTMHLAEAALPGDEFAITAILKAALLTRNTAPLSAAAWFGRALKLMPESASDTPVLLSRQAVAYWKGSRPEAAIEVGVRALEKLPPGSHRTKVLATVINANYSMGRYIDALKTIEAESLDAEASTVILAQQAQLLAHIGRTADATKQRDQVVAEATKNSIDQQAIIFTYVGHVSECIGDHRGTLMAVEKLTCLGEDQHGLGRSGKLSALESAAYLLARSGSLFEARQVFAKVTALLPVTGYQDVGGQNIYTKARIEYLMGAWDDALATIRSGTLRLDFEGLKNNMAWLRLLEAEILTDRAQLLEASDMLESSLLPEECVLYTIMREVRRANIAISMGDYAEAERVLTDNLAVVRDTGLAEPYRQLLAALIDLYVATNRKPLAVRYCQELRDEADRSASPLTKYAADMGDAALGDHRVAEQLVERCEAEGRHFLAAQAHFHLASLGIEPGRNLFRSLELFSVAGAVHWQRRTLSRSKEFGLSLADPQRTISVKANKSSHILTHTEIQLVRLTQQGLTNKQIAAVLHYSVKTIEVYLSRLYQKVGCHSRVELVLAAERGSLRGYET